MVRALLHPIRLPVLVRHWGQPELGRRLWVAEEAKMNQHRPVPVTVPFASLLLLRKQPHLARLQEQALPSVPKLPRSVVDRVHAPRPQRPPAQKLRGVLLRVPPSREFTEPVIRRRRRAGAHPDVADARERHLFLAPVVHAKEDFLLGALGVDDGLKVCSVGLLGKLYQDAVAPTVPLYLGLLRAARLSVELGGALVVLEV
mmetsp:Transcript_5608/g.12949  ORF Transcript_5608/g.12949 Transcript_5608/m.12949 type:complete len:201 (+) Transcript_5608:488-1090(+)